MPDISIIFATCNRADILHRSLLAYHDLDTQGIEWEIIVADNASKDHTPDVLREMSKRLPLQSFMVTIPGKNRCLNRAIKIARGRFWIFTDDDILPDPAWLKAYLKAADDFPEDSVFGGRIDLAFPPQTPFWIKEIPEPERTFAFSSFNLNHGTRPMSRFPNGPNMAIRPKVFEKFSYNESIGPAGTSYAMGSETELLRRLQRQGYRCVYVSDSIVEHIIRSEQTTLRWLAGRARRLGRGQFAGAMANGGVCSILLKSFLQVIVVCPSYFLNYLRNDRKRFWSVWHLHKSCGRFYELLNCCFARGDYK